MTIKLLLIIQIYNVFPILINIILDAKAWAIVKVEFSYKIDWKKYKLDDCLKDFYRKILLYLNKKFRFLGWSIIEIF